MNRIIGLKTIIFVVVIFLCSCVPSQSPPHPEGIPNGNLNQVVKIIAPQEWNTFKLGNSIDLEITNLSNRSLVFDKGFGVRIFLAKDNQWVEIKDKLKSIGTEHATIIYPRSIICTANVLHVLSNPRKFH